MPKLTRRLVAIRRGVTLVELLVAIVLLSIVGTAMTRLLLKQQQYYKDVSRQTSARREIRLGATVLPAELHSISSAGGDIISMSEDQVELRAFIGTSIVCARNLLGIRVPPTNLANHTLTSYLSVPQIGDLAFIYNDSLLKGAEDDVWDQFTIIDAGWDNAACPGAPYADPALDPPATKPRRIYVMNRPLPDSVRVGAVVRFARPVRYKMYQEASGNWYLGMQEFRLGWQGTEPLSGPYRAFQAGDGNPSGLQFRYYDSLGVRITNMANTKDVARVDVFLRTNAGVSAITERQGRALGDSIVMRVAIRNFK